MSRNGITNKNLYEKLEEIRKITNTHLTLFKLVNAELIEKARDRILKVEIRKKIYEMCDNKRGVTQIAHEIFPTELIDKSLPKISYHLAILEDYGLLEHRDNKSVRYYYKKRE